MSQGAFWRFRSGALKCAKCDGKGWFSDEQEPNSPAEAGLQVVYKILKMHPALNIDDITRFTGIDIPSVYHILLSLKDKGLVGVKGDSPKLYFVVKLDV